MKTFEPFQIVKMQRKNKIHNERIDKNIKKKTKRTTDNELNEILFTHTVNKRPYMDSIIFAYAISSKKMEHYTRQTDH